MFFGFHRYSSVTDMFLQLCLPSFDTVLHNARMRFVDNVQLTDNRVVAVTLFVMCVGFCVVQCMQSGCLPCLI